MKLKRVIIGIISFVSLIVLVGVVTVRRTQEAGFDWFGNEESRQTLEESSKDVQIAFPRLPENPPRSDATSEHLSVGGDDFETTPQAVNKNSTGASSEKPEETSGPKKIVQQVPFTAQAPLGKWIDARQQDGCEEATALMAMRWVEGKSLTLQEAEKEIIAISEYEQRVFGNFHDTSAHDSVERIFKGYFEYTHVEARSGITIEDIKDELANGHLVIVPVNGQKLGNPYYTPPGPERHMLVVIGYDPATDEFITNDPGTRRGKWFRYSSEALARALQDYLTGNHKPAIQGETAMIVVGK